MWRGIWEIPRWAEDHVCSSGGRSSILGWGKKHRYLVQGETAEAGNAEVEQFLNYR